MHYIIIGIIVLALTLLTVMTGCKRSTASRDSESRDKTESVPTGKALTREEAAERLKALVRKPPPKKLRPGAMCYLGGNGRPNVDEYVCPTCAERTLFNSMKDETFALNLQATEAVACRRLLSQIKDLSVALDESLLCTRCTPDAAERYLVLIVNYDGTEHRVEKVSATDLELLKEFLAGRLVHKEFNDSEVPLKDYAPRLKELLGIEAEK